MTVRWFGVYGFVRLLLQEAARAAHKNVGGSLLDTGIHAANEPPAGQTRFH